MALNRQGLDEKATICLLCDLNSGPVRLAALIGHPFRFRIVLALINGCRFRFLRGTRSGWNGYNLPCNPGPPSFPKLLNTSIMSQLYLDLETWEILHGHQSRSHDCFRTR